MTNVNYTCPRCGAPMTPGDKFCGECGADFIEELSRFCPNCHVEIRPGKKFCYNCGTKYLSKAGFFRRYIAYLEGDPEVKAEYDNFRNNEEDYDDRYSDNRDYQNSRAVPEEYRSRNYENYYDGNRDNSYDRVPQRQNNESFAPTAQQEDFSPYGSTAQSVTADYEKKSAAQLSESLSPPPHKREEPAPGEPFNYEQCQHVKDMFDTQRNDSFRYMPEPARPDFIKPREELFSENRADERSVSQTDNGTDRSIQQAETAGQSSDESDYSKLSAPEQNNSAKTVSEQSPSADTQEKDSAAKENNEALSEQVKQVNSLFSNQSSQFNSSINNQKSSLFAQVSSEINDSESGSENTEKSFSFNRPAGLFENTNGQQAEKNEFVQYKFDRTSDNDGISDVDEIVVSSKENNTSDKDTQKKDESSQDDMVQDKTVQDQGVDTDKEQKRDEAIKKKLNREEYSENSHLVCKSLFMIVCIVSVALASFAVYLVNDVLGGSIADEDISYLKDKCSGGDKVSCRYLSEKYYKNAGLNNDYGKKAYFLALETCNKLDDALSCELIGDMLRDGKVVTKDLKKAHKYYAYSCVLLSESGCQKNKDPEQDTLPFIDKLEDVTKDLLKKYFYEEQVRTSFVKGLTHVVSSYDMDLTDNGLNTLYKGNYKVSTSLYLDDNQRKVRITNIYDRFSKVLDAYIPQMHRNCSEPNKDKEGCRMDGTEEYAIGQHDFNNDGIDEIVIAEINHSSSNSSGTGVIVFDVTSNKYQSFGTPDVASDGQIVIKNNTVSMMSADGKTGYTWKYENEFFNRYPLER